MARLEAKISRRKQIKAFYRNALGGIPGIEFMPVADYGEPNHWLTVILITPELFGVDREAVRLALEAENIESRPVWKPMHMQPMFRRCRKRGGEVAEEIFRKGLCLPSGSNLSTEDLDRVVSIIKRAGKR